MALEEYVSKMKNAQDLLDRINLVCDHEDDPSEKKLKQAFRKTHRRLVEDEW